MCPSYDTASGRIELDSRNSILLKNVLYHFMFGSWLPPRSFHFFLFFICSRGKRWQLQKDFRKGKAHLSPAMNCVWISKELSTCVSRVDDTNFFFFPSLLEWEILLLIVHFNFRSQFPGYQGFSCYPLVALGRPLKMFKLKYAYLLKRWVSILNCWYASCAVGEGGWWSVF